MEIDWQQLFVPDNGWQAIVEIAVRGTIVYLALFVATRFLPRRTIGGLGGADLLVIVVIADAVQNGMSGEYHTITEAMALAAIIFGWATFIDWLDYKFPQWHLAAAKEVPIVVDGKILHKNLKRQQITEDELLSQLRMHGQDSTANVRKAYIEGDGHVSVILRNHEEPTQPRQRQGVS
ncbi:MAG TPA: YetF domain-containing protein [Usitatibacter sp.]|nr:YetF domain-containing protein [Usitatibacter sp.]